MEHQITRRTAFALTGGGLVAAVGTAIAAPPIIEAGSALTSKLTAIPTDVYEAIDRWHRAHRRAVAGAKAYSASLNAKPIDKVECARCFIEYRDACEEVPPIREAMIAALLDLGGAL